jgi:hypothetical protein
VLWSSGGRYTRLAIRVNGETVSTVSACFSRSLPGETLPGRRGRVLDVAPLEAA